MITSIFMVLAFVAFKDGSVDTVKFFVICALLADISDNLSGIRYELKRESKPDE